MMWLKSISKKYENVICENLSMEFYKGEITAILGASGCGKTSLLNIAMGIDKDYSGSVIVDSNIKRSVVFQEDRLLEGFTVYENIAIVNQQKEECIKCAEIVGMASELDKKVVYLSGGMKRRLALARAIAYDGDLFLMDEPFKGIDMEKKIDIIRRLKIKLSGKTCVFVTHDTKEALEFAHRLIILQGSPLKVVADLRPNENKKDLQQFENWCTNYKI